MHKQFISAQELLEDSFKLADQVYKDGFRPQFIVGIWRGGAPIGIAVQEFFDFKKVEADHISVRTSSYAGINKQHKDVEVNGLHYIVDNINTDDALLIVDDVFDSGRSIEALITQLKILTKDRMPTDIRIACPWYKPKNNTTNIEPNYYLHQSDDWLVFPHELSGLTAKELLQGKTDLVNIAHLFIE